MSTKTVSKAVPVLNTVRTLLAGGDCKINDVAMARVLEVLNEQIKHPKDTLIEWVDSTIGFLEETEVGSSSEVHQHILKLEKWSIDLAEFVTSGELGPFAEEEEEDEEEVEPINRARSNGVFVPPTPLTKEEVLVDPMRFMNSPHEVVNEFRERAAEQTYNDLSSEIVKLTTRISTLESMGGGGSSVDTTDFELSVPDVDKNFIISKEHKKLLGVIDSAAHTRGMVCAMFEGPPSSGKSEAASQLAAISGRKFFSMNCSTVREPQQWFGNWQARDGKTFFDASDFVKAISTVKTVIRLEELNRLDPIIQNPLLELLQDRGTHIEGLGNVRIAMDTIFVGTVNIGNQYQGTFRMCESLMSRFTKRVIFQPLSEKNMAKVLVARTGVEADFAKKLASVVAQVQSKCGIVGTGSYDKPITYRQAQDCCFDWPSLGKDAIEYSILNHFDSDGPESDRAKAITLFAGKSLL